MSEVLPVVWAKTEVAVIAGRVTLPADVSDTAPSRVVPPIAEAKLKLPAVAVKSYAPFKVLAKFNAPEPALSTLFAPSVTALLKVMPLAVMLSLSVVRPLKVMDFPVSVNALASVMVPPERRVMFFAKSAVVLIVRSPPVAEPNTYEPPFKYASDAVSRLSALPLLGPTPMVTAVRGATVMTPVVWIGLAGRLLNEISSARNVISPLSLAPPMAVPEFLTLIPTLPAPAMPSRVMPPEPVLVNWLPSTLTP